MLKNKCLYEKNLAGEVKPEFISIAAYLENSSGHFYHYHHSLQQAIKDFVDFRLLLAKNHTLPKLPENWYSWFKVSKKRKGSFFNYLRIFSRTQKKRIIFLEYFQRRDFLRFTIAAFLRASKKDTLWILYRDDFRKKRKKERLIIKFCSKLLFWRFSSFTVLTDTEQLQKLYTEVFSHSVHLLPINHAPFYYPKKTQDKIVLSWLGPPRIEKGLEKILSLLQLKDPMAKEFVLQLSKQLDPIVSNGLTIKKLEKILSPNSYTQALLDSDCILLPYDPFRYEHSSSGIFVEAIAAGKIPFVTANIWPAFELAKYDLCELILNWEDPNFFQKIYQLTSSAIIRKKLFKMQQAYISYHNPLNFKKSLIELLKK